MSKILYFFVWISRCFHTLGFGIQSPTDYQFDRMVINEHRPYYAYEELGHNDSWLRKKLGRLYFRLANWRQPQQVIDRIGIADYIHAGCKKAQIVPDSTVVELAFLSDLTEADSVLPRCDAQSVVVVENIWKQRRLWKKIISDPRIVISYDLFYCGILIFDTKRVKQHYKINF